MIRVGKPMQAPAILRKRGRDTTIEHQNDYDEAPGSYDSGDKTFEFESSIYGAKSVKNALIKAQFSKCAFCESKFTHIAYGDVEHFRPKGGYKQNDSDQLQKPGYYWLAYEWPNFYAACQICNQRYKKNLFPLSDPTRRAENHHDDIATEDPLLIDPGQDDPADFIGFRGQYPYAINGNLRGKETIRVLGLDREELATGREDRLAELQRFRELCELLKQFIVESDPSKTDRLREQLEKTEALIASRLDDSAEYAAMARAVFAD